MNIAVITVPDSSNCGSFLQAFAMKTFLESYGHHVTFIKTRSSKYVRQLFYTPSLLIRSIIKWPVIGYKRWLFWKNSYKMFSLAWKDHLTIKESDINDFDLIVLGSDEIWNVKTAVFNRPIFWGDGHENVVAYAVSCGRATIKDFEGKQNLIECMKRIPAIFPRDESTNNIVTYYTGKGRSCVCDPTLLIRWEDIETALPTALSDDYLMVYAYSVSDKMKDNIIKYAKANKLRIVSICFFYMWADLNLSINPLQLFTTCKHASAIVTETFHGSIFAALSGSKFVSFPTGSKSKVVDFLKRAGCENRIISCEAGFEEFASKLAPDVDMQRINSFVSSYRDLSSDILLNAIREIVS